MTIARFALMPDMVSLFDAVDRLGTLAVPVDLWETKDAYHPRADLPGVTPDELEINATSDSISISGEVRGQTDVADDGWLRQERRVGKFQRAFTVPVAIDPSKVEATFENGVLSLVMPKAENTKPRTIKVNATKANSN
jgi:HSP20 family protein